MTLFFFFNDTATTEIYTLSLHDALPICKWSLFAIKNNEGTDLWCRLFKPADFDSTKKYPVIVYLYNGPHRSEEHTSELQSQSNLVCRLLLEKKKKNSRLDVALPVHYAHG